MFTLGLTGGIGSGKSTAARMLVELSAVLIDADALSRASTAAGGAAMPALRNTFGQQAVLPDGSLDRAYMRELVFRDASAKAQLEAVVHPIVRQGALAALAQAREAGRWVVQDIPLLVESGRWRGALSAVLVIDCLPTTQITRVQARSGMTQTQIEAVMRAQASREQRLAAADHLIFNDGIGLDELRTQLAQLVQRLPLRRTGATPP